MSELNWIKREDSQLVSMGGPAAELLAYWEKCPTSGHVSVLHHVMRMHVVGRKKFVLFYTLEYARSLLPMSGQG